MSESSSSEKTEEATPKKLADARKKGQVASSKDLAPAFILLVGTVYFFVLGEWFLGKLMELFILIPQLQVMDFKSGAMPSVVKIMIQVVVVALMLPFVLVTTITAILSFVVQFGFVFSFDPIKPKMSKISLSSGFKRIFSVKQLVTTGLSLLKTIVASCALLFVVYVGLGRLLNEISQCELPCQITIVTDLFGYLLFIIIPLAIALAILDFLFQKHQFAKDQKMTKDEVKREMKEMFGDPHIRGERDSVRREMNERDVRKRIKTARLLLVDIGQAVALHYDQEETPLPIIVAIGKDAMARKMVEIAQVEKVPILTDGRLVADLLEEGDIDQYIPTETIERVAMAMRKTNATN